MLYFYWYHFSVLENIGGNTVILMSYVAYTWYNYIDHVDLSIKESPMKVISENIITRKHIVYCLTLQQVCSLFNIPIYALFLGGNVNELQFIYGLSKTTYT